MPTLQAVPHISIRRRAHPTWVAALLVGIAALACDRPSTSLKYNVVRDFPHDTAAFTQGLVYDGKQLYESTGRLRRSQLRRVDLQTGSVLASTSLPDDRFGEGIALLHGKLYQLTWKNGVGYVYDERTLARIDSFTYHGEGWGLTTDGNVLIMSDGTATLRFLDPDGFRPLRELIVQDGGSPLKQINELEYARGELFANVYQSDWVVRIDPESGKVRDWIDLAGLLPKRLRTSSTDVLNGIAFDDATGHLFVTGKLWPRIYELRLAMLPGEFDASTMPGVSP